MWMCARCLVTLFKRKHYNEETELQEKIEKFRDYLELGCKNLLIITRPIFDGYEIEEYLGVQSAEIVAVTSIFKNFSASWADFLGTYSHGYTSTLSSTKNDAFEILKYKAALLGGNAVIGVDIDYIEINTMLGVVVSGTVVKVKKVNKDK
ncbi:Domain of uncharacterised function (DUF74) [[Clostridium] sordellii]|nr:Domain of uncharacterised function (DUF74) [[Clostridium] sordellii] [Paeniclostridium sordellii]